jgi:hypothetical protein
VALWLCSCPGPDPTGWSFSRELLAAASSLCPVEPLLFALLVHLRSLLELASIDSIARSYSALHHDRCCVVLISFHVIPNGMGIALISGIKL